MPCDYEIDSEHRLVRTRAWGVLTRDEAAATRIKYVNDPAFRADFSQLYDLREVTGLAMTAEEIRELSGHSPFSRGARRAAVAPQTAVYGALRMFALQREASGSEDLIRVFKSFADAIGWLGLENSEIGHSGA